MDERSHDTTSRADVGTVEPMGTGLDFAVQVDESGEPVVVALAGELDAATVERLRQPLLSVVDRGHRRVVLDVEHLVFVDSSGLNALVEARRRLGEGGVIELRQPSAMLRRLLEVTALEEVFPVCS